MLELVAPTVRLREAWWEAHREWGPGAHEDGFGLRPDDEVDTADGFATWVDRWTASAVAGETGCTARWIIEGDRVLGGIALRHGSTEFALRAGHIGYGVRPSARRRGVATAALGMMLDHARGRGMRQVLLVCAADNIASARTIEHHGGLLESVIVTDLGPARRYWIALGGTQR